MGGVETLEFLTILNFFCYVGLLVFSVHSLEDPGIDPRAWL